MCQSKPKLDQYITTYGNARKALKDRVEEEAYELIESGDIADIEELKEYINERG